MAAKITLDDVTAYLGSSDPDPALASVIEPVVSLVESWKGTPISKWPEHWRIGTIMLIARIDRRRMSPSGVETVTEMGPVYISRKDPEVAQLLELGTWAKPVAG